MTNMVQQKMIKIPQIITSFLLVLFLSTSHQGVAQYYRIHQLTVDQNLSHSDVNAITQDSLNYIWLGTNNGLNRYNGYEIEKFQHIINDSSSLPSNRIQDLSLSKTGSNDIIITTERGISVFEYATQKFKTRVKFKKYNNIYFNVFEDEHKTIWYVDKQGLLHGVDSSGNNETFTPPLIGPCRGMGIYDGNIWMGIDGGVNKETKVLQKGILVFDRITKTFRQSPKIRNRHINRLKVKDNGVYIASSDGIYRFTGLESGEKLHHFQRYFPINDIEVDYKGDIWLSSFSFMTKFTETNGIRRFSRPSEGEMYQEMEHYQLETSFKNSVIDKISIDNHDILWIGSWGEGTFYIDLREKSFKTINSQKGYDFQNDYIGAILQNGKNLWVGTRAGINQLTMKQEGIYDKNIQSFLDNHNIRAIHKDHKNQIWVCASTPGLFLYEHNQFTDLSKNLDKAVYNGLKEDDLGRLWIITANHGIIIFDPINKKQLFRLDKSNFLPTDYISHIYNDPKYSNIMWLSTKNKGLLKVKVLDDLKFEVTTYSSVETDPKTIGANFVWPIVRENNNTLWVGTIGGGLNKMKETADGIEFERIIDPTGSISNDIESLEMDNNGDLWIGGSGLCRYSPKNKSITYFDVNDGLQSNSFKVNASASGQGGLLYFGGTNGLNYFTPTSFKENPHVPSVVIESINIDNNKIKVGEEINGRVLLPSPLNTLDVITLQSNENNFSISFAGIHMSNTYKNQYAYMLEGASNKWTVMNGDQRKLIFTKLEAGDYTLRIKSANGDRIWSNEKHLIIKVLPPWYETIWFKTAVLVLAVLLSFLYYKQRTYALKRRQKELEEQVDLRTQELQTANHEITAQAESLKQKTEELSLQAEELSTQRDHLDLQNRVISEKNESITASINYAKTIQTATLPITQTFKKHFGDHFVLYRPKDIVSGDFYWMAEHENMVYVAAVDCTGHGVPGAFMSMIGSSLLNKIVHEMGIYTTHQIVEQLDVEVSKALKQETSRNDDGMDLVLCSFEKNEKDHFTKLSFTGAKNDLYYFKAQENEIIEIKGDKRSVGGKFKKDLDFSSTIIDVQTEDKVYLISDGYLDQNRQDRKRIGKTRFKDILQEAVGEGLMKKQLQMITQHLDEFQGQEKQRDDITVLGIKII